MQLFSKKSIIKKTAGIGGLTLLSRFLGITREILMVRYLGAGAISDAFVTAYKTPNSLRKMFAEGALSAALVPTLVSLVHSNKKEMINKLISLSFLIFESFVLLLCGFFIWHARWFISTIAPGFSPEQVSIAVPYLQILMPFIFFLSSSALLAGALQSVRHFFVPAFSPVLLNIVFVSSLVICLTLSLPVEYLCFFILFGGFVQLVFHVIAYKRLGFSFGVIDAETWHYFGKVIIKFLPCLVSLSIMELGLYVDTSFASYLPVGSISLIKYANRFMGIALGVFAVSFSTVLLSHFSRITMYAPKRIGFYLLEACKLVFWATIPTVCIMGFFSEKIFLTLFLSNKFTAAQASEAGFILIAFLAGLFFFSFNKIILNAYYSLHNTWIPAVISVVGLSINILLDYLLIDHFQATGLAFATSIAFSIQVFVLLIVLNRVFAVRLYLLPFFTFVYRFLLQLFVVLAGMFAVYRFSYYVIGLLPGADFFLRSFGFWIWVGPLVGLSFLILFVTRKMFNIRVYFLD